MSKATKAAATVEEKGAAALYRPSQTGKCSTPLRHFILEYDRILNLFFFVVSMATHIDRARNVAAKALDGVENKLAAPDEYERKDAFNRVHSYADQFSRNMIMGMANNFFSYVSEILQLALVKRHEILRSSEKVTTEEVLQFSKVSDLVAFIADRKLHELSYGGLKGLEVFFRDRLGIDLFASEDERKLLSILTELRNVHTHNRGVINALFLSRIGTDQHGAFKFTPGKKFHVDMDQFAELSRNAIDVALRIDEEICRKFKLKRSAYKAAS